MAEPHFREEPIRSDKIRRAAAGEKCTLNLPDICCYDPQTVVLAHIHDEQFGKSQKADDISGMFCCWKCHAAYDLHRTGLDDLTLLQLVFRAYQRTLRRLVLRQIVFVPIDPERLAHDKPVSPRKPKEQRRAVGKSRPMESRSEWPEGRKLLSRNNLRKEPT